MPSAPVCDSSQYDLLRLSSQSRLSANDKGDKDFINLNEIYLTAEENSEKLQLRENVMNAVRPVIASGGNLYFQKTPVKLYSTSGWKEGRKEGTNERRKEGTKEGRKERRKERRKEGRKERRNEGRNEGRKERRKERMNAGRNE